MKNNPILLLILFLVIPFVGVFGQELNCTQTLRTVRSIYDQGRLHEIPPLLAKCLAGGFTETEKVEAYKILVLTYIYLEEPAEADKAMLNLLATDHFFIPNKAVDPVEFQSLWKKFRTKPVWSAGVKFGAVTNQLAVTSNHYVWAQSQGQGKYSSKVGFQFGLIFEKEISKKFTLNPELFYTSYGFDYANSRPIQEDVNGETEGQSLTNAVQQGRGSLNVLFQCKPLVKDDDAENLVAKFIPYFSVGPSINYLMKSSSTLTTNVTELVTGSPVDTRSYYKSLNFSLIASVGVKYRIGGLYIMADIRHQYGFNNVVDPSSRYSSYGSKVGLGEYGYVDNDFRLSQTSVNLGIIIPKFSPKKLIK
jgi:hypothetical protein